MFGKGDLAKTKKELAAKDEEIKKLQAKIAKLEAEKSIMRQKHESDIAKLRNDYQKEIDAAIKHAENAERKSAEKNAVIERQKSKIDELDRMVNPQRYQFSSGAELIGHLFLDNNPYTVTLKIWTKVKEVEHTAVTYLSDSDKRLKPLAMGNRQNMSLSTPVSVLPRKSTRYKPIYLVLLLNWQQAGLLNLI